MEGGLRDRGTQQAGCIIRINGKVVTNGINKPPGVICTSPSTTFPTRKTTEKSLAQMARTTDVINLSCGAKRAYSHLESNSQGKGILSDTGLRLHNAPLSYSGGMFEFQFDRPEKCINIPRDFLPVTGTDEAIQKSAIRHAKSSAPEDVNDMFAFIKEVRAAVRRQVKAEICLQHGRDCKTAGIRYKNGFAGNKEEVFRAWTTCNPDKNMIKKMHTLLYRTFCSDEIEELTYFAYVSFGFWLDKDADGALLSHKNAGDLKAKKCSIRTMVRTTARDHVRGRYTRKSAIPHGIILTISQDEERELGRHKRKEMKTNHFDFRRFVKGWKSPKHLAYCSQLGYSIQPIPELEPVVNDSVDETSTAASSHSTNDGISELAALLERPKDNKKVNHLLQRMLLSSSSFILIFVVLQEPAHKRPKTGEVSQRHLHSSLVLISHVGFIKFQNLGHPT